ncbi:MAG: tryptophan--tRNA ligase [Cyanobacteria bacterium SZAS LIN-2]|nr:tryptophan--tRNA ligase [Cyanobacteria bacterium SZAS LIN-3]MBS1998245.1 tryptophan--tRNA ligase [Cyanobacteria bacterium SZAS LIN-2]MBS2006508.1 tryptophan--tRNA ligase [Cyanobacteria bacterium SZAS TMP-1]
MTTKRIMSGMRPTGRLHLGHYFGALTNWLHFQNSGGFDPYFSIVDWHALTTKYQDTSEVKGNIFEIALDWLCVGIDPEKATIYVQSAIPEIAELHLLFSMFTPHNWVEREPTLKDMVRMLDNDEHAAQEKVTYGLLGYPVLMASDILTFRGELVPVGKDQESHLEFARDVARRFNHLFKTDYFPEPQPKFTETPLLKGVDGLKMGKSFNNDIKIADTDSDTAKRVKQMITDRTRIAKSDPGHTDLCEVPWPWYNIIDRDKADVLALVKDECESAKIGCVDCKTRLAGHINDAFRPFREKREKLASDPDQVRKILEHGNAKARKVAKETLSEVREIMGMTTWPT